MRWRHHATFVVGSFVLSTITFFVGHLGGKDDLVEDVTNAAMMLALFWCAVLLLRLSHRNSRA